MQPLLEVRDGRVDTVEKIRTKKKAYKRLIEMIAERVDGKDGEIRLATLHANALDDAEYLLEELNQKLDPVESIYSEVSPVVGANCGPGTVGIAYMVG